MMISMRNQQANDNIMKMTEEFTNYRIEAT